MEPFSVRGRRVVVVGAARSGVASAELLVGRGAEVVLSDSREHIEAADVLRSLGIRLELGGHQARTLAEADLIVVSPGVPLGQLAFEPARLRNVELIGELELAYRLLRGPVIAVTGTKGKSTTTTLIGRMLTAAHRTIAVGGNIGVPLSSQVEASTPETVHVVEASSFQLESTTTFKSWMAVWLNVAADHLDRHHDLDSYVQAKARILANQTPDDWAVLNADDDAVKSCARTASSTRVWFSLAGTVKDGFVVDGEWIGRRTGTDFEPLVPLAAVALTGRHMLNNVLAATAAAHIAGVSPEQMREALEGFHGLVHVMEPVGTVGHVRFVNDSKATNVEAARCSIESFDRGVVAIVGGHFKGGDLRDLGVALRTRGIAVVAIGDATDLVVDALSSILPVVRASSMADAVVRGYQAARPDGVVLLAPACASFDWFRDYAERGRAFKDEVLRLKARVEDQRENSPGER